MTNDMETFTTGDDDHHYPELSGDYPAEWLTASYWERISALADEIVSSQDAYPAFQIDTILDSLTGYCEAEDIDDLQTSDVFWSDIEAFSDIVLDIPVTNDLDARDVATQESAATGKRRRTPRRRRDSDPCGRPSAKNSKGFVKPPQIWSKIQSPDNLALNRNRIVNILQPALLVLTIASLFAVIATQCLVAIDDRDRPDRATLVGGDQVYALRYIDSSNTTNDYLTGAEPFVGRPTLVVQQPPSERKGLYPVRVVLLFNTKECGTATLTWTHKSTLGETDPTSLKATTPPVENQQTTTACYSADQPNPLPDDLIRLKEATFASTSTSISEQSPLNVSEIAATDEEISNYVVDIDYTTPSHSGKTSLDLTMVADTATMIHRLLPTQQDGVAVVSSVAFTTMAATSFTLRSLIRRGGAVCRMFCAGRSLFL